MITLINYPKTEIREFDTFQYMLRKEGAREYKTNLIFSGIPVRAIEFRRDKRALSFNFYKLWVSVHSGLVISKEQDTYHDESRGSVRHILEEKVAEIMAPKHQIDYSGGTH